MVLDKIRTLNKAQAEAFNCAYEIREGVAGTVLVNTPENTRWAVKVAKAVFGEENVVENMHPYMGSEDFAFMLQEKPGCYVWLGAGRGPGTPGLHNPHYDFNDDTLAIGASYWVTLARQQLASA